MLTQEIHKGEGFLNAGFDFLGGSFQLRFSKILNDLGGFLTGCTFAFLCMDRFQHHGYLTDLPPRHDGKHIAVKMNDTTLVFRLWEDFPNRFQHAKVFVSNEETHAGQSAFLEPDKKVLPALTVFFHSFGCPQDLTVTLPADASGYKNRDILYLSSPTALEIDTINVDIRIFSRKRPAAPCFNVSIGLLIQTADRSW